MPLWKYQCWRCNLWIPLIHWLTVTQYHKVLTSVYISILNLKIWTTYTCSHSLIDHRFFVLVSPRSLKFGMQPLLWCYRWEKMKDFSKLPTGTPAAYKKLKREFFPNSMLRKFIVTMNMNVKGLRNVAILLVYYKIKYIPT